MRSYRLLADEALLQLRSDRVKFAPYGLAGGDPGGLSRNTLTVGDRTEPLPGKVTMELPKGALVTHVQAGAGGYGDPFTRDPALVREDVLDGKVSPTFARERHGVHIDAAGRIDEEATRTTRSARARQ